MNEFLHGSAWVQDGEGISAAGGALPSVENDTIVQRLNVEAGTLFESCYEFDSHGQACWFNEVREKADRERMLKMIGKLVSRLEEIDDGSHVIEDFETSRVQAP